MAFYRPSTSPYQYPRSMQSWTQGYQRRILGSSLVAASTSNSAGGASRVFNWLKQEKGTAFALKFFRDASFGPYVINQKGTGLIWN